jgi:hypothetical protein
MARASAGPGAGRPGAAPGPHDDAHKRLHVGGAGARGRGGELTAQGARGTGALAAWRCRGGALCAHGKAAGVPGGPAVSPAAMYAAPGHAQGGRGGAAPHPGDPQSVPAEVRGPGVARGRQQGGARGCGCASLSAARPICTRPRAPPPFPCPPLRSLRSAPGDQQCGQRRPEPRIPVQRPAEQRGYRGGALAARITGQPLKTAPPAACTTPHCPRTRATLAAHRRLPLRLVCCRRPNLMCTPGPGARSS